MEDFLLLKDAEEFDAEEFAHLLDGEVEEAFVLLRDAEKMVPLDMEGFDLLLYIDERGKLFHGEAKLIVFINVREFLF